MEDSAPRTVNGAVLSIADKADSIAGMFALGLQPTGSKIRSRCAGGKRHCENHLQSKLAVSLPSVVL